MLGNGSNIEHLAWYKSVVHELIHVYLGPQLCALIDWKIYQAKECVYSLLNHNVFHFRITQICNIHALLFRAILRKLYWILKKMKYCKIKYIFVCQMLIVFFNFTAHLFEDNTGLRNTWYLVLSFQVTYFATNL